MHRTEWFSSFLAPLLLESLLSELKNRGLFSEPTWQSLPHPRASQFLHLTDLSANTSLSWLGGQLLLGGTMSCSFLCPYSVMSEQTRVYSSFKTAYELPSPAHPESRGWNEHSLCVSYSIPQWPTVNAIIWSKARFSLFLSTLSQGRATYFWP